MASPSARPVNIVTSPPGATIAAAGWATTPKRSNTSAGRSLIWANVNSWRSMNSWKEASSPDQATPTNVAFPAQSLAAASTEAASALHVLQVGAQNQ